jgi:ribosomal protein S18 acetylase RimI-like enzyme
VSLLEESDEWQSPGKRPVCPRVPLCSPNHLRGEILTRHVVINSPIMPNGKIEIIAAKLPDDIYELAAFDKKVFSKYPKDVYAPEYWLQLCPFWMIVEGKKAGCTALQHNVDYDGKPREGYLFVSSTGIDPEFRRRGLGKYFKNWHIEYGRKHGFNLLVTSMRTSNEAIIKLNEQFGFRFRASVDNYYLPPEEPAIIMELPLTANCPFCGAALRTARAKQCRFCHGDWH